MKNMELVTKTCASIYTFSKMQLVKIWLNFAKKEMQIMLLREKLSPCVDMNTLNKKVDLYRLKLKNKMHNQVICNSCIIKIR